VTWEQVPGHVSASETHGETTLVVERDALVEACEHLRDEHGFNFLSDITPTDYLGWATPASPVTSVRRPAATSTSR
jgi:NADH:ubiquinone oxidoreductase subunit C